MSCEKCFRAIIDEARWQLLETPDDITAFVEALSSTNKRASPFQVRLFIGVDAAEYEPVLKVI